jgi:hypothetical protein
MQNASVSDKKWIPEIMYEEDQHGVSQALPFILVPKGEEMPKVIFIWENSETGEFEPDADGNESPIVDSELRQYARMDVLKNKLSLGDYDKVRVALGLEPMASATQKGQAITARAKMNAHVAQSTKKADAE